MVLINLVEEASIPLASPFQMSYSGEYFYIDHPDLNTYDIEDIAHSLSNICRWNGHCRYFYSVAEHSIACAEMAPEEYQLEALLHDAAEAYIGDIPKPIKNHFPQIKAVEDKLLERIFRKYNCRWPLPPEVHEVDLRMLVTEALEIMPNFDAEIWGLTGVQPYDEVYIDPGLYDPNEAKENFLEMFYALVER